MPLFGGGLKGRTISKAEQCSCKGERARLGRSEPRPRGSDERSDFFQIW